MSSVKMAISQIGISYPDDTWGSQSRIGSPFYFVMKDILTFDQTLNDSISRLKDTRRTCYNLIGVGDGKSNEFRGFQYSSSVLNIYDDKNLQPDQVWHPRKKDIVYWAMNWDCLTFDVIMSKQLDVYYGNITAENLIHNILPIVQTGNLQVCIYDYTNMLMYVSNARASYESGKNNAFERKYIRFNMDELFSEKL